ncbi:hypothetical protein VOLCADRAFT_117731 [Volvox carteri f. nagariensis]|uniref:Uncharacterized protein n=1 Tax=Volvox carteri f. nagariensis TaxID=3068 RepID=D8TX48_VOLCA|nr:uncharacterized protein VOLCADRAFT_117731 [Volvox carteri f. nagariensis]EFJ47949.1 hypothetical protein VOLCADRAFT_117731 [Volvox carteri f. nagariensis]|eukprot:XP_002951055.1 hypothetical protein VOLCADRAFT_117731 [Volvox carteri f. nagariensis]
MSGLAHLGRRSGSFTIDLTGDDDLDIEGLQPSPKRARAHAAARVAAQPECIELLDSSDDSSIDDGDAATESEESEINSPGNVGCGQRGRRGSANPRMGGHMSSIGGTVALEQGPHQFRNGANNNGAFNSKNRAAELKDRAANPSVPSPAAPDQPDNQDAINAIIAAAHGVVAGRVATATTAAMPAAVPIAEATDANPCGGGGGGGGGFDAAAAEACGGGVAVAAAAAARDADEGGGGEDSRSDSDVEVVQMKGQCYCFVCDVKASECQFWGTGASSRDHANARPGCPWSRLRVAVRNTRDPVAKRELLAAEFEGRKAPQPQQRGPAVVAAAATNVAGGGGISLPSFWPGDGDGDGGRLAVGGAGGVHPAGGPPQHHLRPLCPSYPFRPGARCRENWMCCAQSQAQPAPAPASTSLPAAAVAVAEPWRFTVPLSLSRLRQQSPTSPQQQQQQQQQQQVAAAAQSPAVVISLDDEDMRSFLEEMLSAAQNMTSGAQALHAVRVNSVQALRSSGNTGGGSAAEATAAAAANGGAVAARTGSPAKIAAVDAEELEEAEEVKEAEEVEDAAAAAATMTSGERVGLSLDAVAAAAAAAAFRVVPGSAKGPVIEGRSADGIGDSIANRAGKDGDAGAGREGAARGGDSRLGLDDEVGKGASGSGLPVRRVRLKLRLSRYLGPQEEQPPQQQQQQGRGELEQHQSQHKEEQPPPPQQQQQQGQGELEQHQSQHKEEQPPPPQQQQGQGELEQHQSQHEEQPPPQQQQQGQGELEQHQSQHEEEQQQQRQEPQQQEQEQQEHKDQDQGHQIEQLSLGIALEGTSAYDASD